jgi:hypothetical protein
MLTTDVLQTERGGIERRIAALRLDLAQAEGALKFLEHLMTKSKGDDEATAKAADDEASTLLQDAPWDKPTEPPAPQPKPAARRRRKR